MSDTLLFTVFRRQVLQRLSLPLICWPTAQALGDYDVQQHIHESILLYVVAPYQSSPTEVPRWTQQFCIQLAKRVEAAALASEEGDIYDPLIEACGRIQSMPASSDAQDLQNDVPITYAAGNTDYDALRITLLEKPRIVSGSGFTGHRTWEAALAFAQVIEESWLPRSRLKGKRVLELGAGTGLLSFVCASRLAGAARVIATDGDEEAVRKLQITRSMNSVTRGSDIDVLDLGVYRWGEAFQDTVLATELADGEFDLLIGADVVSSACKKSRSCHWNHEAL